MRPGSWLSRFRRSRAAREWSRIAGQAQGLSAAERRNLQPEAQSLRRDLTHILQVAHPAAALSRASIDAVPVPPGTDWLWRPDFLSLPLAPTGIAQPENGHKLGPEVALWHDCPERALILRQLPNAEAAALAAYELRLEVLGFSGSYLSLSVDLPDAALQGLSQSHILRLETTLQVERPLHVYGRLNVRHGPNTDEILRDVIIEQTGHAHRQVVEFDMAGTDLNQQRLEKIWLDLIFENPQMNAIALSELIMSRHLRANF